MANAVAPSKCVVLVPAGRAIEPLCEEGLRQLEQRGYPVWRVRGYAAIDLARNQMASDALAKGFDELMWIDADIGFRADDVERLRRHPHPCVAGVYPMKGVRRLAASLLPGTRQIHFGKQGGLLEVRSDSSRLMCSHDGVTRLKVFSRFLLTWDCYADSFRRTSPQARPSPVL